MITLHCPGRGTLEVETLERALEIKADHEAHGVHVSVSST